MFPPFPPVLREPLLLRDWLRDWFWFAERPALLCWRGALVCEAGADGRDVFWRNAGLDC